MAKNWHSRNNGNGAAIGLWFYCTKCDMTPPQVIRKRALNDQLAFLVDARLSVDLFAAQHMCQTNACMQVFTIAFHTHGRPYPEHAAFEYQHLRLLPGSRTAPSSPAIQGGGSHEVENHYTVYDKSILELFLAGPYPWSSTSSKSGCRALPINVRGTGAGSLEPGVAGVHFSVKLPLASCSL